MSKRISLREAYKRFHAEDRARQAFRRELKRIELEVESLSIDLAAARARQDAEEREAETRALVERMFQDKAFNRTLRAFTGRTPHGWKVACGCDGRMLRLLQEPGWPVLEEAIRRIRIAKGMVREPCRCEARVKPDATLALKIKLGY